MPDFLKEIATFVLEQLSSLGVDALSDKVSNYALQKADESVRDYLSNHTSPYDYDKLDAFLTKEGIYSSDQSMENSAGLKALTAQVISDFRAAHPEHIGDITVLKDVINSVYRTTIGQLSMEGRILYNQGIKHDAKVQQDHTEMKRDLEEIKKMLASGQKVNLPKDEVRRIYNLIISAIANGSIVLADSVVTLLDNQVSEDERFYSTACHIQLDYYLRGTEAVLCACKKFAQEAPTAEVALDVAIFLVQVNEIQGLSSVHGLVENPLFEEFSKKLVTCEPNEIFDFLIQEDHQIKTEYQTCEYAWWAIGNAALTFGSKLTAYQMYLAIEQKHPSFWARWQKCRASAKLAVANFIMTQTETAKSKLYYATEKLLEFSQTFSLLHDEILAEFVNEVLLCAGVVSLENFNLFWNRLSPRMRDLPCAREHWYHVHITTNWREVKERELRNFCCSEGKKGLWSVYLHQRAQEDAAFVINEFSENPDSLQKDFIAVSAYAWALVFSRGSDVALETIESMALSTEFAFPKSMLLTEISFFANSEKKNQYLDQALSTVKSVGGVVSVMDVRRLTDFLVRDNRWQEAELLLKQYQEVEPSLGMLRLNILMPYEERSDTCRELIKNLERNYAEDSYLLYCKGVLEERSLAGSGYESFEKAFHASPSANYAYAVLAARLNRHILKDDDILAYASRQEDIRSKYISGLVYLKMENMSQADILFLQALLLCNDEYDGDLFGTYVGKQIEKSEHLVPPEEVKSGTCIILTKERDGTTRKVWIHGDAIIIPQKGSTFAGYTHIQSNTPEALLLLGHKQNDAVELFGDKYVVTAINYGDTIATKYCMEQLLAHGKLQAISVSENRIDEFCSKIKEITKPHSEHVQKMLELYQSHTPGITLHLLVNSIGGPYFEVLRSLCLDPNIQFWAGCDGNILKGNCILTLSAVSTLASLNIHPPKVSPLDIEFFITPMAKAEVEAQIREHRHSRSSGIMGFDKDENPYLIENTPENKHLMNTYYACLLEWCNYAKLSRDALPEEYPEKLKEVAAGIGAQDMEAIVLAQKDGYSVFSDDLLIRKYLSALNISNATAIGIMILMDIQVESMLGHIEALISANYQSPITPEFIRWLSQKFSSINGEEEQETVSIQAISVIKKQIEIPLGFETLLYAMQSLKMEKYEIHEKLFWIISTIISEYLLDHPQLLSMEG